MFTLLIPIWKRPTLTERVINYYKERQERFGFDLVIVGSEEPDYGSTMGVEYVHAPNNPVSFKWNAGIERCKDFESEGVLMVGSDNYVCDNILEYFSNVKNDGAFAIQWRDIYFYRCKDSKLSKWDSGKMGVGRFFSRTALDLCDWRIHDESRNKALDHGVNTRLRACGVGWKMNVAADIGGYILDVKYSDNISPEAIVDAGEERSIKELPEYIQSELLILNEKFKEEQIKPRIRKKIPEGMARIVAIANPNHQMKAGEVYEVSANTAMVLIEKGFAYLEGQEPKEKKAEEKPKRQPRKRKTTK